MSLYPAPRIRSGAFPTTPRTTATSRQRLCERAPNYPPRAASLNGEGNLPGSPSSAAPEDLDEEAEVKEPLIPTVYVSAPSQRLVAVAVWVLLWACRVYDWILVLNYTSGAFNTFTKWVLLDFVFIFLVLPAFKIPWLELSQSVCTAIFCIQAFITWGIMFQHWTTVNMWLLALVRLVYDRELAISEHNVKPSDILFNSSLIMGKHIINLLPDGSAKLNPDKIPYCIGPGRRVVEVPLYFNATTPQAVELIRVDFDSNHQETVKLGKSELREIAKISKKAENADEDGVLTTYRYDYPVKKVGAYRLHRVLDEYKLEVQRITDPTWVVACPSAQVRRSASSTRCMNEHSEMALQVTGTPPLKVGYSRTINGKHHSLSFHSLQPDGYSSPLLSLPFSGISVQSEDVSWAGAQSVSVSLNESMNTAGDWQYSIDQVQDAFGNVVDYSADEFESKARVKNLQQSFIVKERPRVHMAKCDLQNPIKFPKGGKTQLPFSFGITGRAGELPPATIHWKFSPFETLTKNSEHGDVIAEASHTAKHAGDVPTVYAPGLYTLTSISCDSCEGEIEEPSSCLVLNPLQPQLTVRAEEMTDKCAGNKIGLKVDLDLVGTAPFRVHYEVQSATGSRMDHEDIRGMRRQVELEPRSAGHYIYRFKSVDDAVYQGVSLPNKDEYKLEVSVKPPAHAQLVTVLEVMRACLDAPVEIDVSLSGDGPFTLEWELIHDGLKKSSRVDGIDSDSHRLKTAPLSRGGDYTLALTSITDKIGCRVFLKDSIKIEVRRQRPRAAFGLIENKRAVTVVEDAKVSLPLRLSGDGPFTVKYRENEGTVKSHTARSENDVIQTSSRGVYEIVDVHDVQCPGQVDAKANKFEVDWFPRPHLSLVPDDSISEAGNHYIKKDVCEDDIDGLKVALKGSPPYHVSYEIKSKPKTGSESIARKIFDAALPKASIPMDTTRAGLNTYTFSELADSLYSDRRRSSPLVVEQIVNAKPSGAFVKAGQIIKMCMSEHEAVETIPITLQGVAPFYVEMEVRHHTGTGPEVFRIPDIASDTFEVQIPRPLLKLGTQTFGIHKVRDGLGCQQKVETGGARVQVQLYDAPAIYALEARTDYCVGDRVGYTLSGTPPFEIQYEFGGQQMKAKSASTNFRRIAESAGDFTITSVSDRASECRAKVNLKKTIHSMPSVQISHGEIRRSDIHEGSDVDLVFDFTGTPPFEFTYTRSTNAKKGHRSAIIETRHDISYGPHKVIMTNLEGTYEVVSIKDHFCAFSILSVDSGDRAQKRLTY